MESLRYRRIWHGFASMLKDAQTALSAALLSAALALMLSWLGDSLLVAQWGGTCIGGLLVGSPCQRSSLTGLLVLFGLIGLAALCLFRLLRRRMPVEVRSMQPASPRAVIMMCISKPDELWRLSEDEQGFQLAGQDKGWQLGATFEQALTSLNTTGSSWPWHQLLRGIAPHRPSLRQLVLLTTPESREKLAVLKPWLATILPDVVIRECACSGRDVAADSNAISKQIKELKKAGFQEGQQIIDISGATKVLSIAATLATLDNDCTFQYVRAEQNTPGDGEVLECYSSVVSSHE